MSAARKALRGASERHGEGVPRWRGRSYLSVSVKTQKHTLAFTPAWVHFERPGSLRVLRSILAVPRTAFFWTEASVMQELPTHSGHMRPGIVRHKEEPGAHCTSVRSGNLPVGYDMEFCSLMFTTASPDSFTLVTCAHCEPALICEDNRAPVAVLPILVFSGKCQSSCAVLGCEHRSH
ncbi:unnamed protein product [Pleuronectes platessa]|uniref:Uncharacterized protein n=1 Tax=Pleuronectes platessa TaxID=8262 RepID=A0A9N7VYY8_PLEPL|nr:unnamed protein product [Pleuronectes platessa]